MTIGIVIAIFVALLVGFGLGCAKKGKSYNILAAAHAKVKAEKATAEKTAKQEIDKLKSDLNAARDALRENVATGAKKVEDTIGQKK
jgi:ABC-type transporter MlaC component